MSKQIIYLDSFDQNISPNGAWNVVLKNILRRDLNVIMTTENIMQSVKDNDNLVLIFRAIVTLNAFDEMLSANDRLLVNKLSHLKRTSVDIL